MIRVSCILPTFNRRNEARTRIYEILKHNNEKVEIIVVNDGGTDIGPNSCDRVKIINLPFNSGSVSIPRNIGITHAQGEYICHIDDDVIQYPRKIQILSKMLDESDTKLVFGQRNEMRNGQIQPTPQKLEWNPTSLNGWGVDNGQIMYRRDVYKDIGLCFARRACDWELAKKIRPISKPFLATREPVCCYIWHDSNRSLNEATKTTPIHPGRFKEFFMWGTIPETV